MLTPKDETDLLRHGKTIKETEAELARIAKGFAPAAVKRAATVGDGIARISEDEATKLASAYDKRIDGGLSVAKFVPASGAASRMFKPLHQYAGGTTAERQQMDLEEPWKTFFAKQDDFAFGAQLSSLSPKNHADIVNKILGEEGLAYGSHPKGLVAFHKYEGGEVRTAAEEHISEAMAYCMPSKGGLAKVHYTVPVGMEEEFRKTLATMLAKQKGKVEISFSIQPPSTDVPALTPGGEPARDENGKLILRPGGHGALIGNLNKIDADIVFVKNIDNVAHGRMLDITTLWKKVIAGFGLERKQKIDNILKRLDEGDKGALSEAEAFLAQELKISVPTTIQSSSFDVQRTYYIQVLDRPLRVCGMVKNEGEPGGGPFWVEGKNGVQTLQVVESAQMNLEDPKVAEIVKGSTHFNPVDLFCCLKDRNGKKYDLHKFVDPDAGFTTRKSVKGKDVIGMELPGLWNGAMANWLTFFVEVPVSTFTPVKTVMDLLRPEHQA